jgi:hypothetical protein
MSFKIEKQKTNDIFTVPLTKQLWSKENKIRKVMKKNNDGDNNNNNNKI